MLSTLHLDSRWVPSNAGVTGHETGFRPAPEIPATGHFRDLPFRELIWTWSVDQIGKLAAVPWQEWPLLKQVLLVLILAAVLWALYRVGWELLEAGAAILTAFANLLGVLVQTLPQIFLAGVIALGGVWLVNHLDNSSFRTPAWMQASDQHSPPPNQNSVPENQNSTPQKTQGSTPQGN